MNILFSASEMEPFCKTGGLADVIGALPPVLAAKGHTATVVLPGYASIDRKRFGFERTGIDLVVQEGQSFVPFNVSRVRHRGVDVYLLENESLFGRPGLYGDINGDYSDNAERFVCYARGVVALVRKLGQKPDIVHAHDWQAGLVPAYLKTVNADDPEFSGAATLFTVHNLGYQGLFPMADFPLTGLPPEALDWRMMEYWGKISFLKAGLVYADALSTVSETYADEITREPLGFGMHGVFEGRRGHLFGIVNGIDQDVWNPANDSVIPASYSASDMSGKAVCRAELLNRAGLAADADTPVFGMVTRLDDQKGLDILEETAERLAAMNIRIVILGTGTKKHHEVMNDLMQRHPESIKVFLMFDNTVARLIYAGCDAFLMPSKYEPCGLGQLIAMRYGDLPVVHATGGLKDTVSDLDGDRKHGDGFVFEGYTPQGLIGAVARAATAFREKGRARWNEAVERVMTRDFSWSASAEKYIDLYRRIGTGKRR